MALEDLTKQIADILFTLQAGQRLPTVRELSSMLNVSIGSVQTVFTQLEESGCVRIEKRGHLGSFMVARSLQQLWSIAVNEPLIMALPLPSNRRLEGLATAIKQALLTSGIDVFLIFVRGSKNRLRALQEGRCHVAVMSGFAAQEALHNNSLSAMLLSPFTFISGHKVYISPLADLSRKPIRVLVDIDSTDLQRFSEIEFGSEVQYIPGNFLKLPNLLMHGVGDIMIWEIDEAVSHLPSEIETRPLSESLQSQIGLSHTQTALVYQKTNIPVEIILQTYIQDEEIKVIQEAVLHGEQVPEY